MTIISFEHKFVFIKTKKAASTSVEAFLRRYTGPNDVVTYITPRDEKWCADRGWRSKNYATKRDAESEYVRLCQSGAFDSALRHLKQVECVYVNHMPANDVKRLLEAGGHRWDDFYSFSIDRHPYTWLLSVLLYDNAAYHAGGTCPIDIENINRRAVELIESKGFMGRLNYNFYSSDGRLLVDEVIHYEHLHEGLSRVLTPLLGGVDLSDFPFLKKNATHLSPLEIFDEDTLKLLKRRAGVELELAGYKL
jgi:hypothetical protein